MSLDGFPRALDSAQPSSNPSPVERAEALFIRRGPRRDDNAAGVKVVVLKKRRHAAPPEAAPASGHEADAEDRAPRVFQLRAPTAALPPQPEATPEPAIAAEAPAPRRRRNGRIGHDTRARLIRHVLVELPPPPAQEPTGERAVRLLHERLQRLDALLAEASRAAAFEVAGPAEGWAPF